jgi:hypothetical protein
MAATKTRSVVRRFLRLVLIVAIAHAIVILGLHIWFVTNARSVLKQIVTKQSHGKLKMELSHLSFDFFSNKLQIRSADLVSTDSLSQPASYHIKFRKLTLRINSFWPLLTQRKLLLDSIKLHDPEIDVIHWRRDVTSKAPKDELSISQEMGKLYNSMLDGLEAFGIRRIIINNAKLRLINKMKPGSETVTISKIYLDLIRTASGRKRDEFLKNQQSVELSTSEQNIALPGGRHRLSFKTFHLELFEKRIELDSCTVIAAATETSKSNYKIFFNKLLLLGVDFDAMYRLNLIRADSVYCENPLFDINLNLTNDDSRKNGKKKKDRPDPEKIVRELTGDLDLAFVGVKDAGIHINITGTKQRSLFNSNKDDFRMYGLRINADSSSPVVVDRFDMLVRDYHLYNLDSSAAYSFDSIHFLNNKIILNNFLVATQSSPDKIRNDRDFRIPYFELTGVDWYQLIFDQNLKAEEAVLYNPVINYVKRKFTNFRKHNMFATLQNLDSLLTLNKINIFNGQINMQLNPTSTFNLQNVNLSLYSNKLFRSNNKEGLRKAVDRLSFSNGLVRLNDITAELQNVRYTGSNLIHADNLSIISRANKTQATIKDVYIDNMLLDDQAETMVVDGLRWKNAKVILQSAPDAKSKKTKGSISLKNISGNNTQFDFSNGKATISTFAQSIKISSLTKNGDDPIKLEGFLLTGNDLSVNSGPMNMKVASYQVASELPSWLTKVEIERIKEHDSLNVKLPRVNFSADINGILAKDIHLINVEAPAPVITFSKWTTGASQKTNQSSIRIDRLSASEPSINIATHRNDSVTLINIPRSDKSVVKASDLKINSEGTQIGSLSANTKTATFIKSTGETFGVEKGKLDVELSNIRLSKKDGKSLWSMLINKLNLQDPNSIAIGKDKNKLTFNQVSLGNLNLSSEYIADFNQLIKFNVAAWLRATSGQYIDSTTTLKWYNAEYNYNNRTLSLDSFTYRPTQSLDSVLAHTPFQTDYITLHSGAIKFIDFNLDKYKKDSALIANILEITNPVMTIFRDKGPPFLSGVVKPLPVNMIKKISLPVSIRKVNINEGNLSYTEKNAKTRAEGTVFLTHITGVIKNLKNLNLTTKDSLSLTLKAYLMDSAHVSLKVKESYTDTLAGFLMSLKVKPTTLSFLNPVLTPLSNVKIVSGSVDSFYLRAIAQDDISLGKMNMYYHNLRIKLMKAKDPTKSSILGDIASWIANTFVIKKNNNGRTGLVYFERLRDRSFFNYIVKMTFSGLATSVGVKKNRKYIRQYKRALQERDLPPMDFDIE